MRRAVLLLCLVLPLAACGEDVASLGAPQEGAETGCLDELGGRTAPCTGATTVACVYTESAPSAAPKM